MFRALLVRFDRQKTEDEETSAEKRAKGALASCFRENSLQSFSIVIFMDSEIKSVPVISARRPTPE